MIYSASHITLVNTPDLNPYLAINDYTQAIKLKPQFTDAYYERGYAYVKQGKIDLAITDYNQVIKINPQLAETINPQIALSYVLLGSNYLQKKNLDEAIQNYNQALTIKPNISEAYALRGIAHTLKGNKPQGIKDLETAKQLYQQQGDTQKTQETQELLNQL